MVRVDIKNKKVGLVDLSGPMTINEAVKLSRSLLDAFSKVEHLLISMEEIESVDLSFLQLLRSCEEYAKSTKKRMSFVKTCPDIFKESIEELGMSHHFKFDFENPDEILAREGVNG